MLLIVQGKSNIELQTRLGNDIENSQYYEIAPHERHASNSLKADYPNANFITSDSPIYNCHGLTFASRRTGIDDTSEILNILEDDKFIEIGISECSPGDIVIYFSEFGDAEHSGFVIESPNYNNPFPLILSKWGSFSEVLHRLNQCPYHLSNVQYYRINE